MQKKPRLLSRFGKIVLLQYSKLLTFPTAFLFLKFFSRIALQIYYPAQGPRRVSTLSISFPVTWSGVRRQKPFVRTIFHAPNDLIHLLFSSSCLFCLDTIGNGLIIEIDFLVDPSRSDTIAVIMSPLGLFFLFFFSDRLNSENLCMIDIWTNPIHLATITIVSWPGAVPPFCTCRVRSLAISPPW